VTGGAATQWWDRQNEQEDRGQYQAQANPIIDGKNEKEEKDNVCCQAHAKQPRIGGYIESEEEKKRKVQVLWRPQLFSEHRQSIQSLFRSLWCRCWRLGKLSNLKLWKSKINQDFRTRFTRTNRTTMTSCNSSWEFDPDWTYRDICRVYLFWRCWAW
jgi:hypothetical protein